LQKPGKKSIPYGSFMDKFLPHYNTMQHMIREGMVGEIRSVMIRLVLNPPLPALHGFMILHWLVERCSTLAFIMYLWP